MCMMKNSGEKEACEVARNLAALGVYSSREQKHTRVELEFAPIATDAPRANESCPTGGTVE